jgi:hypothetical protein
LKNWLPLWWLWSPPMLSLQSVLYCFRGTVKVTFKLYFVMKHNVIIFDSMLNWSKSFMCDDTFFISSCINESLVKRFVSEYGPWKLPWVRICRKSCGTKKLHWAWTWGEICLTISFGQIYVFHVSFTSFV